MFPWCRKEYLWIVVVADIVDYYDVYYCYYYYCNCPHRYYYLHQYLRFIRLWNLFRQQLWHLF